MAFDSDVVYTTRRRLLFLSVSWNGLVKERYALLLCINIVLN